MKKILLIAVLFLIAMLKSLCKHSVCKYSFLFQNAINDSFVSYIIIKKVSYKQFIIPPLQHFRYILKNN